MIPTLGRTVHFCVDRHTKDGTIRAAIISHVEKKPELDTAKEKYDGEENAYNVQLHVFTPWGVDVVKYPEFYNGHPDNPPAVGSWFWPPRV
jgi:hypothetical protein